MLRVLPIRAEVERRQAVGEAILRINYRLRLGAFDMDFSDGEIRYRIGADVEGGELTEHMAMTMIGNACGSIDFYGTAVMEVLFGRSPPEDAASKLFDDSETQT